MKSRVSHSVVGIGCGGLVLTGMVVLTASCASSGRAAPVTGPEAEALFAALSGTWVLDERESSPPMGTVTSAGPDSPDSFVIIKGPGGSGQIIGASGGGESSLAGRENTLEVLARRPVRLVLGVDGERLVYTPAPGQSVTVLMSGAPTAQHEGEHRVQTRVIWDDEKLGLEHTVNPDDRVRVVLEVVDGQLKMTRTMRIFGAADSPLPLVLVYRRDEGGPDGAGGADAG